MSDRLKVVCERDDADLKSVPDSPQSSALWGFLLYSGSPWWLCSSRCPPRSDAPVSSWTQAQGRSRSRNLPGSFPRAPGDRRTVEMNLPQLSHQFPLKTHVKATVQKAVPTPFIHRPHAHLSPSVPFLTLSLSPLVSFLRLSLLLHWFIPSFPGCCRWYSTGNARETEQQRFTYWNSALKEGDFRGELAQWHGEAAYFSSKANNDERGGPKKGRKKERIKTEAGQGWFSLFFLCRPQNVPPFMVSLWCFPGQKSQTKGNSLVYLHENQLRMDCNWLCVLTKVYRTCRYTSLKRPPVYRFPFDFLPFTKS